MGYYQYAVLAAKKKKPSEVAVFKSYISPFLLHLPMEATFQEHCLRNNLPLSVVKAGSGCILNLA